MPRDSGFPAIGPQSQPNMRHRGPPGGRSWSWRANHDILTCPKRVVRHTAADTDMGMSVPILPQWGLSLCGGNVKRSSSAPFPEQLRSGTAFCAALSLAVWLCPFSAAYGGNDELEQSPAQLAQSGIEVPSRVVTVQRGRTVLERERPELDPLGIRVGSFILSPSLSVHQEYNDNIFATETDTESDFITRILPELSLRSDWNNHSLAFFGSGNIGRYWDNSAEDFEDFNVGTSGRLDVRRDTWVRARAEYQDRHEERSSPDDVGGDEPTEYNVSIGRLEGFHRLNRLSFTLGGAIERFDFDDVGTSLGTTINNDDRDRDEYEASLRVGYELVPSYEAFVRGAYLIRDYDSGTDDAGRDRDSDGFEVVAGVSIDFGGITFGDFFAGYRQQEYDDPTLDKVSGPVVGADITWNVTPLTTFIGTVSREIRESTTGDGMGNFASGRFFTTVGVSAQHELLRNLLLGADVSYSNDDFKGIDRSDDIYRFGLDANYMMFRNLYLRGGYRFRSRDSEFAGADFAENIVFIRLQAQY